MDAARRRVLLGGATAAAWIATGSWADEDADRPSVDERQKMAEAAAAFRTAHDVPGLAVAIGREGRLVYDEAFGLADRESGTPLTPAHRFRIASISKSITAIAVFRLIESGRLALDDRVLGPGAVLGEDYGPVAAGSPLRDITVDHLLTHTAGGWPNDATDPMFRRPSLDHAALIAATLAAGPPKAAPGTSFAYSNFGYCLLGRVIEKVSGLAYAAFVQESVLGPSGAAGMEIAGNTLGERRPSEVRYHGHERDNPYLLNVRRMDAHGGWIASASALVRVASALDGVPGRALLAPGTVATMTTPSRANPAYARGWRVNARGNAWHTGSFAGTATIMVRTRTGLAWAALINTRLRESTIARDLDRLVWTMARSVPRWRA